MTGPELAIVLLIYLASLLLGQRAIALQVPEMQELGFVIAAGLAISAAALLYFRRERHRAAAMVPLSVGGILAIAAVLAGMFTQLLWQSLFLPVVSIPIAAVATAFAPLFIFPLVRRLFGEGRPMGEAVNGYHVTMVAALAAFCVFAAYVMPALGRSNVRLITQNLPGIRVALPDWNVSERSAIFDSGTIKLDDPGGFGRYMALHWSSGDPVQPHEYVKLITGDQLPVRDRQIVTVGGHEGVTFYLESDDHANRAAVTIWNCPQDHRSMWIFSYLNGPKGVMMATHNKVVRTVRCHRPGDRENTGAIFPKFVPPPAFERDTTSRNLAFIGPAKQNILFEPAVSGKKSLIAGQVPDAVIAALIKQFTGIEEFDGTPTMHKVNDLFGHERRIWSAKGTVSGGAEVQVEIMAWYCDVRDMTFLGAYATNGTHPLQHAVDILLPAACHEAR